MAVLRGGCMEVAGGGCMGKSLLGVAASDRLHPLHRQQLVENAAGRDVWKDHVPRVRKKGYQTDHALSHRGARVRLCLSDLAPALAKQASPEEPAEALCEPV